MYFVYLKSPLVDKLMGTHGELSSAERHAETMCDNTGADYEIVEFVGKEKVVVKEYLGKDTS